MGARLRNRGRPQRQVALATPRSAHKHTRTLAHTHPHTHTCTSAPQVDQAFRVMWADHGDEVSRQYAGTGAMKSAFTRTGRRDIWGLLDDGAKSLTRWGPSLGLAGTAAGRDARAAGGGQHQGRAGLRSTAAPCKGSGGSGPGHWDGVVPSGRLIDRPLSVCRDAKLSQQSSCRLTD